LFSVYCNVSRFYVEMPPLWHLEELFSLSDKYPSGLEWAVPKAGYKQGEQAGRLNKRTGYYQLFVDNQLYLAHRIVYYMRTGELPNNYDVKHESSNETKDNRLELFASRKPPARKPPKPCPILAE
jgi:hypothetical protein